MQELAGLLEIKPYRIQTSFPEKSIATPFWETKVQSESLCVEEPLRELLDRLAPRADEIKKLLTIYKIESGVNILIRCDYVDRPEIAIPPFFYPLLEAINATVWFDIAYEW